MTAEHAFVVYKILAKLFGAETVEVPDPNLTHDLPAMAEAINDRTKIVYIANPNNPTGTMVSEAELDRFIDRVPRNVVIALDEAYYEFLPDPPNTLKYFRNHPNVIVLRTFSKIQGLAGLRIGYGLAHEDLIRLLQKTRQPFNVNSIAQAGALAVSGTTSTRSKRERSSGKGANSSRPNLADENYSTSRAWQISSWSKSATEKRYSRNCSNEE